MIDLKDLKKEYPEADYLDGWVYPSEGDDYPIEYDDGGAILVDNEIENSLMDEYTLAVGVDSTTSIREYITHTYGSYKEAFDLI